jgi:hypothetical protein
MRWPQDCEARSPRKKRPLASQRPKSREETPKEGGGNAGRATARVIDVIWPQKLQEANQRLLTYSRTFFFLNPGTRALLTPSLILGCKGEEEQAGHRGRIAAGQWAPPGPGAGCNLEVVPRRYPKSP